MSDPRSAEHPVNRLLDIVVEEVSLVDRAANEHRFLIVKRNDPMGDTEATTDDLNELAPEAAEPDEPTESVGPEIPPDPLLTTAIAALEGLTSTVELLGAMGGREADPRLEPLAAELKTIAEALLSRQGVSSPAVSEDEPDTTSAEEPSTAMDGDVFNEQLSAARAALSQLATLTQAPPTQTPPAQTPPAQTPPAQMPPAQTPPAQTPPAQTPPAQTPPALPDELTTALASMGASFRTLADTVREQQQRLARVEKQFGLPNSAPSERVRKVESDEVGWPMDLNNPMDRESVDKAVSFHDL